MSHKGSSSSMLMYCTPISSTLGFWYTSYAMTLHPIPCKAPVEEHKSRLHQKYRGASCIACCSLKEVQSGARVPWVQKAQPVSRVMFCLMMSSKQGCNHAHVAVSERPYTVHIPLHATSAVDATGAQHDKVQHKKMALACT
jgi:hypothetical protein